MMPMGGMGGMPGMPGQPMGGMGAMPGMPGQPMGGMGAMPGMPGQPTGGLGAMPGMPMGGQQAEASPRGPAPGPGQRKPFRSISQVLDTPVTPELLAALPAPVQESNLMMGSKMQQTTETHADREMVNSAMASLRDEVTLLVAAGQQNIVDLFHSLISQLPMRMKLKTAVGKKALLEELDKAAKEIVEGTGRQMDLILLDPEVLKQDGQLVSTLHSKYSVPVVLFSSTPEAVHSQLVDDWMRGPGNGDVDQTQVAARILKWHAKSNGHPEPILSNLNAAPPPSPPPQVQPPSMAPATSGGMMGMPNGGAMQGMPNGGGMMGMHNGGGMPGMPGGGGMMGMQQQPGPGAGGMPPPPGATPDGKSPAFAPLVASLKEEIKELRKELESKRQLEAVPKDPNQITSAMFKSQDGQGLARNLIDEMSRLKKQKKDAQNAAEAAANKARLEAEAKAAEEKRHAQEEKARKLEQEEKERVKERKRQEEEAVRRQKEALEAARAALTPSERRMNAYKLASHSVVVDMDME